MLIFSCRMESLKSVTFCSPQFSGHLSFTHLFHMSIFVSFSAPSLGLIVSISRRALEGPKVQKVEHTRVPPSFFLLFPFLLRTPGNCPWYFRRPDPTANGTRRSRAWIEGGWLGMPLTWHHLVCCLQGGSSSRAPQPVPRKICSKAFRGSF